MTVPLFKTNQVIASQIDEFFDAVAEGGHGWEACWGAYRRWR